MGGRQVTPPMNLINYNHLSGDRTGVDIIDTSTYTGDDGVDIELRTPSNLSIGSTGHLIIAGVEGGSEPFPQVWEYEVTRDAGTNDWIRLIGSTPDENLDFSNAYIMFYYQDVEDVMMNSRAIRDPLIMLSTSDGDISVDNFFLEDQIRLSDDGEDNTLRGGNLTVEAPFTDDDSSVMTISRTFSNQSDGVININKAGLYGRIYVDNGDRNGDYALLAEDHINSELSPTETLSINYKIRTATTANGGILGQFNKILYAVITGSNDPITDINGNEIVPQYTNMHFKANSAGGDNIEYQYNYWGGIYESARGYDIGPTLGTAIRNVLSTDIDLVDAEGNSSRIQHGEDAGQLFFYGSTVTDWKMQPEFGMAQFTITRFFENKSQSNVLV